MTHSAVNHLPSVADFTLSFNCLDQVPLEVRFAAARAAGFVDIGLSVRWISSWLETHELSELDALLDEYSLRVTELEAIRVMLEVPDPLEEVSAKLAAHFHPARLQSIGSYDGDLDDAARRAARVADRFSRWGVDVVLEPLPFTNMQTPGQAAYIINKASRSNLSMCLDVWHLYRMNLPLSHLDDLWSVISTLQISDGTLVSQYPDDLREDCLRYRLIPGNGEFDLVGLLRARNSHRPNTTFSVEVISTELKAQEPGVAAQMIADGLHSVLIASQSSEI